MILFKHASDLKKYVEFERKNGKTIGFAPTMGALHEGHVSLIKIGNSQSDISICSIFINPTQFNDTLDFLKYPITIADDILKLEEAKCNVLFLPSTNEIYPGGTENNEIYDLGQLGLVLEGQYRPGHFQGVCQVMHRLLTIVEPDKLFLGQKDYQQCLVIKKLVYQLGLAVTVHLAETMREPSGLAMSSRNMRLNEDEKKCAASIYQCLKNIKSQYQTMAFDSIIHDVEQHLLNHGFSKVDYITIAAADSLHLLNSYEREVPLVALIAAFIGDVRLIDNMMLNAEVE